MRELEQALARAAHLATINQAWDHRTVSHAPVVRSRLSVRVLAQIVLLAHIKDWQVVRVAQWENIPLHLPALVPIAPWEHTRPTRHHRAASIVKRGLIWALWLPRLRLPV